MKRQELVEMLDEGEFLTKLSEAKIPEKAKLAILKDHRDWKVKQILEGKPYCTKEITVKGKKIAVGERWIDPFSGRLRVNMGR